MRAVVLRSDMTQAQLERVRRRDRETTRRRRAIARGLPDPGPVPDWRMEDRKLRLPGSLPVLGSWILGAACRDEDPELWFSSAPDDIATAQAICTGCPVRGHCAVAAEANAELYGVWGGTDRAQARRAS
jgi:WhiB family transcriptional regulator, redox-sensing transcriptional regulator